MQINADSKPKNCAINALSKIFKPLAKTDLAYWRKRLRKQPNSPNWFVEISRGVRHKLSLETPNLKNTRGEDDWKTQMKINLCRVIAVILLGAVLMTGGCALDPYAPVPDMGTEIPGGGAPASATGQR